MRWLALVLLVACGRVSFEPRGTDGGGVADDAPPEAACTFGPWGAPQRVTELDLASNEFDPSLSRDGLTIYFSSIAAGGRDIWTSTRASIGAPWSTPVQVPELSTSTDEEGNPEISPDGLEMYFGLASVFRMTRATLTEPFANQEDVTPPTGAYAMAIGASLSGDGLEMYFAALPSGQSVRQIFRMRRPSMTAAWGIAEQLPVTDTRQHGFMGISADGLELVLSRDFGGPQWDMFRLTRASTSVEFDPGTEEELVQLNTTSTDADAEMSSTGREMFFSSDRLNGYDIYVTTRDCL